MDNCLKCIVSYDPKKSVSIFFVIFVLRIILHIIYEICGKIIFTTRNIWLFLPILPKNNMSENIWKKLFPHQKPCQGFLNSLKCHFFLYGRIIDKFNNSCAITIFCYKSKYNKNGAIFENVVYYACHIFWTSSVTRTFLCFYYWHILNFKPGKSSTANSHLGNNYCGITLKNTSEHMTNKFRICHVLSPRQKYVYWLTCC